MLNFVISRFCFCAIQNFTAEFQTLLNFRKFRLIIRKRWREARKSISQLPVKKFYPSCLKPVSLWYSEVKSSLNSLIFSLSLTASLIYKNKRQTRGFPSFTGACAVKSFTTVIYELVNSLRSKLILYSSKVG